MDELNKLFELFDDKPIDIIKKHCCDKPDLEYIDSYQTCLNCGSMNMSNTQPYYDKYDDRLKIRDRTPYKRVAYLKQKLLLMGCFKAHPLNKQLIDFIDKMKLINITDLIQLKKQLYDNGLNQYYKYIYSIYFSIMGYKIITISRDDIKYICNIFILFEKSFPIITNRKYIYSYNVIIYLILAKMDILNHNKILLPINNYKIKKLINQWMNITDCTLLSPF